MDAKVVCQMNSITFFKSLPHSTEMTMARWRLEHDRFVLASTCLLLVEVLVAVFVAVVKGEGGDGGE